MTLIVHDGYGYSKTLCEKITTWYLNQFLPKHDLQIEIVHRGLKREGAFGYCDRLTSKSFLIELDVRMKREDYTKTLLHELFHLQQWVHGLLTLQNGEMYYQNERVSDYDYLDQPHEIHAKSMENSLYLQYLYSS